MRVCNSNINRNFATWIHDLSYDSALYGETHLFPNISRFREPDRFCDQIYQASLLESALDNPSAFRTRSILSVQNGDVISINNFVIGRMPGTMEEYFSIDTVDDDLGEPTPVELLQSFNPPSLPPSRLRVKLGAPILLLRNLYPRDGLCNGTRLQITRLTRNCIEARILGGDFDGEIRLLPRIKLTSQPRELPFVVARTQFPISLCFAMTINRSQGQSFDTVGIDLRHSVFSHGQFYVAMSRVTEVNNLSVLLPPNGGDTVQNTVWPEVLLSEHDLDYFG